MSRLWLVGETTACLLQGDWKHIIGQAADEAATPSSLSSAECYYAWPYSCVCACVCVVVMVLIRVRG